MKTFRTLEYCRLITDNEMYHIQDNNNEIVESFDYLDEAINSLYFYNQMKIIENVNKYYGRE